MSETGQVVNMSFLFSYFLTWQLILTKPCCCTIIHQAVTEFRIGLESHLMQDAQDLECLVK